MRDSPTLEGNIISKIPAGSCVAVIEDSEDELTYFGKTGRLTRVLWGYKDGWVFGEMLGLEATGAPGT